MDKPKVNGKAKTINLRANSKSEFFLIHGYTGSPTDFNGLGKYLHKKFNANVKIIRLKGHGTKVEDLDKLDYEDFLEQVEVELKSDLKKGRNIVVGGYCFGGQLALYLAGKHKIKGVFNVSTPYLLKFPFNIPFLGVFGYFKKYWKKRLHPNEIELRRGGFHYEYMPAYGLKLVKMANKKISKVLRNITCPCFSIFSKREPIANYRSVYIIENKIGSKLKRHYIFEDERHNIFYSKHKDAVYKKIYKFFNKNWIFEEK